MLEGRVRLAWPLRFLSPCSLLVLVPETVAFSPCHCELVHNHQTGQGFVATPLFVFVCLCVCVLVLAPPLFSFLSLLCAQLCPFSRVQIGVGSLCPLLADSFIILLVSSFLCVCVCDVPACCDFDCTKVRCLLCLSRLSPPLFFVLSLHMNHHAI